MRRTCIKHPQDVFCGEIRSVNILWLKKDLSRAWKYTFHIHVLTLFLLNTTCPVLANRADPDQLASEEAN